MKIKLLNWAGHGNLGDDGMDWILRDVFGDDVVNEGDYDWLIWGGGTLITPNNEWWAQLTKPEKTIGISLGVAINWKGEHVEKLREMAHIYVRDHFSYQRLQEYGLDNISLSVDLWNYLKPKKQEPFLPLTINLINAAQPLCEDALPTAKALMKEFEGSEFFAMSPVEDIEMMGGNAKSFDNPQELVDYLARFKQVIAMRLHANVAAWVAGVPDIVPIHYDPKIRHFYVHTALFSRKRAHEVIVAHLNEIKGRIYGKNNRYHTVNPA